MLVNFIQDIHKSTKRDYIGRANDNKVICAEIARKFDKRFFDGDRRYGYGGYGDDGRWVKVADKIINRYGLNRYSKVLDIGCGKGFLARDLEQLSSCHAVGYEISDYCIKNSSIHTEHFNAGEDKIKGDYDLIISINTLHNLVLPKLQQALSQITTHSKNAYIVVESYRTVQELHNLQCWSLTAECFFRPEEWQFLFKEWGYKGDWEFIYFE
jgi:SAM-dependent methyltransferase